MLAEIPVALTMAIIVYQDFKYRLVDDWAFVPALAFFPIAYWLQPEALIPVVLKAAVLGGLGLAIYFFGLAAQADAIVLPLLALNVGRLSPVPVFFFAGLAAGLHIAYVILKYRKLERMVDVETALKDDTWIPKRVIKNGNEVGLPTPPEKAWEKLEEFKGEEVKVVVSFGTPLAGYFALGYLAYFLLGFFVQI